MERKTDIKITPEFQAALDTINHTDRNVFLTGKAGTGKSTLLKHLRNTTRKKFVVLAPTGVAALNVHGQTIHSFFGFHPEINVKLVRKAHPDKIDLFKNLETIIIDEISMVRADLLDCVDRALRMNRSKPDTPFGGVQMVFIGDLYQLPPVVTKFETHRFQTEYPAPYFFAANAMRGLELTTHELTEVHRQEDDTFVNLLNRVRNGTVEQDDIATWNNIHDPHFDPAAESDHVVHLTTTNKAAAARNAMELKKLDGEEWNLKASSYGELGNRRMPSEASIKVREGARIMFTTNDPAKRWVNGSLGEITRIVKDGLKKLPIIEVRLDNGKEVEVAQHKWEVFEYQFNGKTFEEEVIGAYMQFPIALAWAVTIHKAQGKTFDRVLVDMGWGAFAHGQLYVALSRCTTFEGITLLKPFKQKDVIVDPAVQLFMQQENA